MSFNTFRDVMDAQLKQTNLEHMRVDGLAGKAIEIDLRDGTRIRMQFDDVGDLDTVELVQEPDVL